LESKEEESGSCARQRRIDVSLGLLALIAMMLAPD